MANEGIERAAGEWGARRSKRERGRERASKEGRYRHQTDIVGERRTVGMMLVNVKMDGGFEEKMEVSGKREERSELSSTSATPPSLSRQNLLPVHQKEKRFMEKLVHKPKRNRAPTKLKIEPACLASPRRRK